jgi:hypothetical protein
VPASKNSGEGTAGGLPSELVRHAQGAGGAKKPGAGAVGNEENFSPLKPVSTPSDQPPPPLQDAVPERLAEAIQAELARLGYYKGRLDNQWGAKSRAALNKYNRKMGKKLPVKMPTPQILKELRETTSSLPAAPSSPSKEKPGIRTEIPAARTIVLAEMRPLHMPGLPHDEHNSYLPPWMRGGSVPVASDATDSPPVSRNGVRIASFVAETKPAAKPRRIKSASKKPLRKSAYRRYASHEAGFSFWPF